MTLKRVTTGLVVLMSALIIYIGMSYLLVPQSMAASFGLPDWPHGEQAGFLPVKGVRDVASGLIVLTLLVTGYRRALGWILLALVVVPFGDGIIVLAYGGSPAMAYGVHWATGLVVLVAAVLLLRERPMPPVPRADAP